MTAARFALDAAGRWSGGGRAFVENARDAAARHPVLAAEPATGTIPLIPRNVPASGLLRRAPYVLAPQNAWPWAPVARGLQERALVARLRIASEVYLRRAAAVLRISGAIPSPAPASRTSPVLHNVLDRAFEEALDRSADSPSPWPGAIVSIGSGYSYRNVPTLVEAYGRYRRDGGRAPLVVAGPAGSAAAAASATRAARGVDGVTLSWQPVPRHLCVAAFREAAAVVLPSRVEASPFTTLEALAVTSRVVVGDIVGNRGILARYAPTDGPSRLFVDPTDPEEMARALGEAEQGGAGAPWHDSLQRRTTREAARADWGDALAGWLEGLHLPTHQRIGAP